VITRTIASNTAPALEDITGTLTGGADEKLLLLLAAARWLA
jgi:undecaprenyl-diphosphatase